MAQNFEEWYNSLDNQASDRKQLATDYTKNDFENTADLTKATEDAGKAIKQIYEDFNTLKTIVRGSTIDWQVLLPEGNDFPQSWRKEYTIVIGYTE